MFQTPFRFVPVSGARLSFFQPLDLLAVHLRSNFGYFPPSTALNYDSLSPAKTRGSKLPDSRFIVGQVGGDFIRLKLIRGYGTAERSWGLFARGCGIRLKRSLWSTAVLYLRRGLRSALRSTWDWKNRVVLGISLSWMKMREGSE